MKTILLAEDNPVSMELFNELLDSYNYSVVSCNNEKDALKQFKDITPDLVIIGFEINNKSGSKILKEMMVNPDVEKIPIIILSENTSFTDTNKIFQKIHTVSVLHEPVKFSYLMKLVAQKLNQNSENGT